MKQKQDIKPRNEYGQRHGLWLHYSPNGNIRSKLRYVNGIAHGICEDYWGGGLWFKEYYKYDKHIYLEFYGDRKRIRFDI